MTRGMVLAAALAAASCNSTSRQKVEFAHLEFDMPGDWQHQDQSFKGVATTTWMPEDNVDAKESLVVIRTELVPALGQTSEAQLAALLEHAQQFAGARVSPVVAAKTASGFVGARAEVDYVPPGLTERYHRIHVMLVDDGALLHVLYTAKRPDPQLTALNTVLATIREGGG